MSYYEEPPTLQELLRDEHIGVCDHCEEDISYDDEYFVRHFNVNKFVRRYEEEILCSDCTEEWFKSYD